MYPSIILNISSNILLSYFYFLRTRSCSAGWLLNALCIPGWPPTPPLSVSPSPPGTRITGLCHHTVLFTFSLSSLIVLFLLINLASGLSVLLWFFLLRNESALQSINLIFGFFPDSFISACFHSILPSLRLFWSSFCIFLS